MKTLGLPIAALASLVVLVPGVASATRFAPLVPDVKPPPPSAGLLDKYQAAVEKGAKQANRFDVLPADQERAAITGKPDLAACKWGACVPPLASALKVDGVVITNIEQTGRRYQVRVSLFDSTGRELIKPVEERCDICTLREVENTIAKATKTAIESAPGAMTAPVAAAAPDNGAYDETKPEPVPDFAKDEKLPLTDEETGPGRGAPGHAPADQDTFGGKYPHWPYMATALGVAAVSLVATGVFGYYASKENQPSCIATDPLHQCPQIYHGNVGPTVAFGAVAIVGVGAAVGLFVWDMRAHNKRQRKGTNISLLPTPSGVYAGAGFEF